MNYGPRRLTGEVEEALRRQAAVVLLGPRQSGKTALARRIAATRDAVYLDLELAEDRRRVDHVAGFIRGNEDRRVVLGEIHRASDLFPECRGHIDEGRRKGKGTGRFLVLGYAPRREPSRRLGSSPSRPCGPLCRCEHRRSRACEPSGLPAFPRLRAAVLRGGSLLQIHHLRQVNDREGALPGIKCMGKGSVAVSRAAVNDQQDRIRAVAAPR